MGGPGSGSGNLKKKAELQDDIPEDLTAPSYLQGEALGFWDRHVKTLAANNLITSLDLDSFATLCNVFADMQASDSGSRLRAEFTRAYIQLARRFGLFPDARKSMAVAIKAKTKDTKGSFDF